MVAGTSFVVAGDRGTLRVPVADVSGSALRLFIRPPEHPAVRSRRVEVDGLIVVLDVLAASHRVTLVDPGVSSMSMPAVSETVACVTDNNSADQPAPVVSDALPARHQWSVGGWTMQFESRTIAGDDATAAIAADLERFDSDASALVAQFPGHRLARTALHVEVDSIDGERSVAWQSWHLYPGVDPHFVVTRTTAKPNPTGRARR